MSNESAPAAPRRDRRKKKEKKSLWQMDLGSLGKKKDRGDADDVVEHAPFVPTLPQVNLLPASVSEAMAVARIRKLVMLAVVLLAAVAGGVWWLQGSTIANAESDLSAAAAENTRLRTDLEALAPVKQMYDEITKLQKIVTSTLAAQPQSAVVVERLATAGSPAKGKPIEFASIDVVYNPIPAAGGPLNLCPNPDPFGTDVTIGCVNFTATASTRGQVSAFLRTLAADPLFVGPYVTNSTVVDLEGAANQVSFAGSTGVSLEGLKTLLTDEQIAAILAPPAPAPEPSSEAGAS